uniref:Uncharacterized protein n=1 Tax=Brassica oleracea var. oleracea TaxID=109376 RepID=A0A0D3CNL8_BRAOL
MAILEPFEEPKLTSNTKPDITACLGAWYKWDRILQTSLEDPDTCLKSLHHVIDTPKVSIELTRFVDPDVVQALGIRSDLEDLFVELGMGNFATHPQVLYPELVRQFMATSKRSFELDFKRHRFEVNKHPVAEVMPVLRKSGQSTSREETVEEMKDCRSILHHWCRLTVIPE